MIPHMKELNLSNPLRDKLDKLHYKQRCIK